MNKKILAERFGIKEEDILQRMDGRFEWTCDHGVGHTIWAPKSMGESGMNHGCDGCCSKLQQVVTHLTPDGSDFTMCGELSENVKSTSLGMLVTCEKCIKITNSMIKEKSKP